MRASVLDVHVIQFVAVVRQQKGFFHVQIVDLLVELTYLILFLLIGELSSSAKIEMINADKVVDPSECAVFNTICVEYGVCDETFNLGRALDSMVAIDIMKRMSDIQKLVVAQLLTRVIDADARDDDNEIKLFNVICRATGVDVLIDAKG